MRFDYVVSLSARKLSPDKNCCSDHNVRMESPKDLPTFILISSALLVYVSCDVLSKGYRPFNADWKTDPRFTKENFTAAVYEHAVIAPSDPTRIPTKQEALSTVLKNLAVYEEQVVAAVKKGAAIIVFPESGLYGFGQTWESMYPYLEDIPDTGFSRYTPCDDPLTSNDTIIQSKLSCLAKDHRIYIVANMGDKKSCYEAVSSDPLCRLRKGFYQFSTNVVYDPDGKQVARYHKRHLLDEPRFSPAPFAEHVTFKTPFGKFATLINDDILFNDTIVYLWWHYRFDSVVLTTASKNKFPYPVSVALQRGFSTMFEYNLLAADISNATSNTTGSGIYSGGTASYQMDLNQTSGKLLTALIPAKFNKSEAIITKRPDHDVAKLASTEPRPMREFKPSLSEHTTTGFQEAPHHSRRNISAPVSDPISFKSYVRGDLFTMVPLTKHTDLAIVCQGKDEQCCTAYYNFKENPHNELYVLGAFTGNHTDGIPMKVRICAILKCKCQDPQSCGEDVRSASATFDHIWMFGTFDTIFILPYVLTTPPDGGFDVALNEFTYLPGNFSSLNGFKYPLLSITIFETYYDTY